ncbi:hypothetical protein HQQ94_00695 [Shewanella sp. VB17]|uniref:hypothetical protein n=1 Tax=Shewanella sp. VB17 TaxID=2739432 RepID=UPI0015679B12|nr:hypothetical protein [Shewanella sp. VB17]NRD71794.1 hypothetical protein [Shewanella sp. VB17]
MEKLKFIFLTLIYLTSLATTVCCILVMTFTFFSTKENYISVTIAFGILTLVFGLISLSIKRHKSKLKNNKIENLVLKIATSHDGLVTAADLALNSSMGLKEASAYLGGCYSNGLCEKRYAQENLVEVFYFKSAISLESKKTSKLIAEI